MRHIHLPVNSCIHTQVAVVGGGTAGAFAAICAAKAGASVVLVEKNGLLGGTITAAGVDFPGLFFAWGKQIIDGPCWELIKQAEEAGGAKIPPVEAEPRVHWQQQIQLNRFIYATILDEFCARAGVDVMLHTMLSHAVLEKDGVRLTVTGKDGLHGIHAQIVIDATGDANLACMLGYPTRQSAVLQPATLINAISGYALEQIGGRL